MSDFRVFKETAMPAELVPNSVIFVAPPGKPGFVEIYVVDSTGTAARRVIDEARVQNMIDAAVSGASGGLVVVDNIAGRDALAPEGAMEVLVVDAAADPTVSIGWARYGWMARNGTWLKLAEGESQDLVLSWANLTGKPTSSAANIDDAVSKRHAHANKTQLDKVGEDGAGQFIYNGARPVPAWDSETW